MGNIFRGRAESNNPQGKNQQSLAEQTAAQMRTITCDGDLHPGAGGIIPWEPYCSFQ
jgi:hypothetical protein